MRALLKRHIPTSLRNLVISARGRLAAPPIDDVVLADYGFVAEGSRVPRLNLMMPNLSKATAFGGVMTGLDIFFSLAAALRRTGTWDLRIILSEPGRDTDVAIAARVAQRHGIASADLVMELLAPGSGSLAMRRGDVVIAYNWWCALNVQPLIAEQARHFGEERLPLVYLIQEYEPNFYAMSTAHMLAREAYDGAGRLWGVFNSSNLHRWFEHVGHHAERSFIFEPVINDALRPYLAQVGGHERARRIVVYGRPNIERNCFPALVRGLNAWIAQDPDHTTWEIVSAGTPHPPVQLDGGHVIRSLGKLSLDDYAQLMLTSSVGISLMASPHPSYPPLEMAHFGLRTVTNGYFLKNLAAWHPNIVSTDAISASRLGETIAIARAASRNPAPAAVNAEFVRSDPYPFMAELVEAVGDLVQT
ncbi:hypothetical protein [Novosphingobium sp.]|uniref:rhamnosyltransferase WsaF family glycosyltransferase n=1 Tax=Novosphingobium sp. TaxID=1874826 RepID=UPI00286DC6F8|nr:hypothetical protein [Novosphingobium sp.]